MPLPQPTLSALEPFIMLFILTQTSYSHREVDFLRVRNPGSQPFSHLTFMCDTNFQLIYKGMAYFSTFYFDKIIQTTRETRVEP